MKHKIIPFYLLLISFFGQISCAPDKQVQESPPPQIYRIEVKNTDNSRFRLNGLKRLQPQHQIELEGLSKDSQTQTQTSCYISDRSQTWTRKAQHSRTNPLPVYELLPIEIFTPSQTNTTTPRCNFKILVFNQQTTVAEIHLEDIEITDASLFSNFIADFMNSSPRHPLDLQGKEQTFPDPLSSGYRNTLCNDKIHRQWFESPTLSNSTSQFPKDILDQNGVQWCRWVWMDEDEKRTWVSPIFPVHHQSIKLAYDFKTFWPNEDSPLQKKSPVARVEIMNRSSSTVYLTFENLETDIRVMPIYSQLNTNEPQYVEPMRIRARWQIRSEITLWKKNAKQGDIHALAPQQVVAFELIPELSVHCRDNLNPQKVNMSGSPISCENQSLLTGYLFEIGRLPRLNYNRWLSPDFWDFKPKNLNGLKSDKNKLGFSSAQLYRGLARICPSRKYASLPKQNVIPVQYPNLCRIYP